MDSLFLTRKKRHPGVWFGIVDWIRTWDWWKLLQEYRRVARPHGVIRITEGHWTVESNSSALNRLSALLLTAFSNAGHSFTPTSDGVTRELANLLHRFGIEQIQQAPLERDYRAGTVECHQFLQDMSLTFRMILPFLRKWTQVPDDYEQCYQQALEEIQQPDFVAHGQMLTVWGNLP